MKIHSNPTPRKLAHHATTQQDANDGPQIPPMPADVLQALRPSVQEWLQSLAHRKYSLRTLQLYTLALRDLTRYLVEREITRVQDMDLACLEGWRGTLVHRGFAPASITSYLGIARTWCRWLSASGRTFVNPAGKLVIPSVPRPMGTVLSEEEMRRFIESIDGTDQLSRRDRAVIELAYACGARLEEIARLNVESLDLHRALVRLKGKGSAERIVPLTRCAVTALRTYLDLVRPGFVGRNSAERALFVGLRESGRLCSTSVSRLIRKRASLLNMVVLPHTIRRSFATHLVQRGAPIAYVKLLLGHATYRHMGRYVLLREAVELDALREGRRRT